jgi:serine/threonine-protein kinase HipA
MKGKALAVQRFDRGEKGEATHMEDFAQVFGLRPQGKYHHRSYTNIAAALRAETDEAGTRVLPAAGVLRAHRQR